MSRRSRDRSPGDLGARPSKSPRYSAPIRQIAEVASGCVQKSEGPVLCAGQRADQEGLSPSGARMRGAVSKSGGNASLAGESGRYGEAYTGTKARAGHGQGRPGATARQTPEGRVSIARWNPKGMRRSPGP